MTEQFAAVKKPSRRMIFIVVILVFLCLFIMCVSRYLVDEKSSTENRELISALHHARECAVKLIMAGSGEVDHVVAELAHDGYRVAKQDNSFVLRKRMSTLFQDVTINFMATNGTVEAKTISATVEGVTSKKKGRIVITNEPGRYFLPVIRSADLPGLND